MNDRTVLTDPSDNHPERPTTCRRCGVCCRKGGPCLHFADRDLVAREVIAFTDLYTIRRGEPVWDNVSDTIGYARQDIVKIRSRPDATACLFFRETDHACAVYLSRPLECRALQCWNIKAITDLYDKQRLSRRDLLASWPALWELVSAHQQTCDYEKVGQLARSGDIKGLTYLVEYDAAYRELVVERNWIEAAMLDFLFGFPLKATVRRYGQFLTTSTPLYL